MKRKISTANLREFTKYANGVSSSIDIYTLAATQSPFIEISKKKKEKRKKRDQDLILNGSTPLRFLCCFALIHLSLCGLGGY